MSEVVWVVWFLEFVLNRCGHFSQEFLGGIDAKHEWSVWEGITVFSHLAGVSRTVWLRRFFMYEDLF